MANRIEWDDALATGVPAIDAQHKELFAAFNDFAEAMERGIDEKELKKLLLYLRYYADWHFEREEDCARRHECPQAEENCQAHKRFRERITALYQQFRSSGGSRELAEQIHAELSDWLVNHIQRIDVRIGHCVRERK